MPDYLMHIQFIIRKMDETKIILNKVLEYNKESYLILGHTFDIINKIYSFINKIVMSYFRIIISNYYYIIWIVTLNINKFVTQKKLIFFQNLQYNKNSSTALIYILVIRAFKYNL